MIEANGTNGVQKVELYKDKNDGEFLLKVTFIRNEPNGEVYEHVVSGISTGIFINKSMDIRVNEIPVIAQEIDDCSAVFAPLFKDYQIKYSHKFIESKHIKTNFDEYTIKELEEKLGHRIKIVDKKE